MAEPAPARCMWASCRDLADTIHDGWPMCTEHVKEAKRLTRSDAQPTERPPDRPPKPCGSEAAYQRHKRNNEEPCLPCLAAHRVYVRDVYRRGKERKA